MIQIRAFLDPIVDWFNPPPLITPDECKNLIERLNGLTTFSQFNNPYPGQFIENRVIVLGTSQSAPDQILIKKPPCSKNCFIRSCLAKQEQLAFLISERLGFNVVPPAVAIEGFSEEIDKISKTVRERLTTGLGQNRYQGVVVQKRVNAHFIDPLDNIQRQTIPAGIIARIISWSLSYFRDLFYYISLNQEQISKAVLFNIVAGRTDAQRDNSMIDSTGKIMEIDNEFVGSNKTTSWLFVAFPDHVLSKEVIDDFLEKDSSVIEEIFKDFDRRYPKLPFWNAKDRRFNIRDESRSNVHNNFKRLQAFLKSNRGSVIKIQDLKTV